VKELQREHDKTLSAVRDKAAEELRGVNEQHRKEAQRILAERTDLLKEIKGAETRAAVAELKLETLQGRVKDMESAVQEHRQKAHSDRTALDLARAEGELKHLESSRFELKQALDASKAAQSQLERKLREQEREFEMSKLKLQMDYELRSSKTEAQYANKHGNA
jgi:hypothetical protein